MSQPIPALTVENIMTANVFTLTAEMTVGQCIGILLDNRISGAPLVDFNRTVITVVTEGDLMKLAASVGLQKEITGCLDRLPKTDKLITTKKSESFANCYRLFLSNPVHRVIVTDGNGKLQGLVSRSNVLRVLYEPKPTSAAPATDTDVADVG